jgi:anti-anti-sigma regulatory factor
MGDEKERNTDTGHASEQVLVIALPREKDGSDALDIAAEMANSDPARHVVVDFSCAQVMTSGMLSQLMVLERQLDARDRRLVLCSVPDSIMRLLRCVGLWGLFRFAKDRQAAMESLSGACCRPS